jgi:acyl-CoA reductase-like NAD-dependent aldehyde dehydrogenase
MFDRTTIDSAIDALVQHQTKWSAVTRPQRMVYLQRCMVAVQQASSGWVTAAVFGKGGEPADLLSSEEWTAGPMAILLYLRTMLRTLSSPGQPQPAAMRTNHDQLVATVFPDQWMDRLLWPGYRGEVWLEPGKSASQGGCAHQPDILVGQNEQLSGRVALVLGAGNIAAISILDSLHKLLVENQVVILKINPVNEYLGEFITQILQPFITDGFVSVVYGDGAVGSYLCQHPAIDTVHITGSYHTHEAIVWGATPSEQADRRTTNQPLLNKPITSELGCVTPVLVVPGNWSDQDLRWQARHVASMVVHNASFNCTSAQVLVLARGWSQRQLFLDYLRSELTQAPPRQAYYPGATERYQAFLDRYPQAEILGSKDSAVPWTLIPNVPAQAEEFALTTEAFCGILAEVSLDVSHAADFLKQAVDFANNSIWGSLSCVVLIDKKTVRSHQAIFERSISNLRYGSIGVNIWTGANFAIPAMTWGAFPGNSMHNVESGIGIVHNAYLFDYPQKSVLYAPFRMPVPPVYLIGAKNIFKIAQCYGDLQVRPNLWNLLRVLAANLLCNFYF